MAFIGLMVPHMVRPIVGPDYRFVIPMSAIAGASFMLLADTIGRTINAPYETPVRGNCRDCRVTILPIHCT